jgi:very-short-patch-repair endonuclease
MEPVERRIRREGWFLRRRDLLGMGYSDGRLRAALARKSVFRVRHGWYSVPAAPESGVRAVRVGGRLTGVSALEAYGIPVPRQATLHVAVPANACRLRNPLDRRRRLDATGAIALHWADRPRSEHHDSWRVPMDDALLAVLQHESREIAVACASALMRRRRWSRARVARVFERAPARVRCWLALVSALDDSHGETFVRLWLVDAGVPFEQQAYVAGAGHLDFRVSPNTYVEVDGAQHDPSWTGESPSSYENDHDRDAIVATEGGTTLRFTYRQLYGNWARCLAAIERSIADDRELVARRARDPIVPRAARPRSQRKRRRNGRDSAQRGVSPPL